jgi:hypothetical protein
LCRHGSFGRSLIAGIILNGLCLLSPHIEELRKMAIPHYLVLHATSMTKFYITVYYFWHSLTQMSFIYCHLNFHANLLRPWCFPLRSNLFQISNKAKTKNMCVCGHSTDPIFQLPTLTFNIGNSTLIFASYPINFYTEFG